MTMQETASIMDILTTAYPKFYYGRNAPPPEKALLLWASLFQNDDLPLVAAAVKALIASKTDDWPPTIGAVKDYISKLNAPDALTDTQAWALVAKAVRRTDWQHPERQFDRLPPDVQAAVGSPHTLVEWGHVPDDTLASVIASQFLRTFRAKRQANKERAALPLELRNLSHSIAQALALDPNHI